MGKRLSLKDVGISHVGFAESARLHQNLPVYEARENSTFETRYLPGDYHPTTSSHFATEQQLQRPRQIVTISINASGNVDCFFYIEFRGLNLS